MNCHSRSPLLAETASQDGFRHRSGSGASSTPCIVRQYTEDWSIIELNDSLLVRNNVWNKHLATGPYEQSIFEEIPKRKNENCRRTFGWRWNWPSAANVVSYPEVILGDKPWDEPAGNAQGLPFRPAQKSVVVDYDVTCYGTGRFNLAFEIWLVSDLPATKEKISGEIMIWIANSGLTPAGKKESTILVGENAFDMWVKRGHAAGPRTHVWDYIAFVADKPVLKGPLDIGAFVDYLVDRNMIDTRHFITCLEFGNEIIEGTGTTRVRDYRVFIR